MGSRTTMFSIPCNRSRLGLLGPAEAFGNSWAAGSGLTDAMVVVGRCEGDVGEGATCERAQTDACANAFGDSFGVRSLQVSKEGSAP